MSQLVDTHCHIHAAVKSRNDYTAKKWQEAGEIDPDALIKSAADAGVKKLICVGTGLADSQDAVDFVQSRDNCRASVGVHPHEAKQFLASNKDLFEFETLIRTDSKSNTQLSGLDGVQGAGEAWTEPYMKYGTARKIVAVGEVGLDYYYEHSPKAEQVKLLEMFLQLATDNKLPVIFHIREAHADFWPILSNFDGVRGVLHSFTANTTELDKALGKGLYIGLNGIMTFTKDENQLEMAKKVPLDKLLLETDAPYLAPKPYRGKVCKSEHVKVTAEFLADLCGEDFEALAVKTSQNAAELFKI